MYGVSSSLHVLQVVPLTMIELNAPDGRRAHD